MNSFYLLFFFIDTVISSSLSTISDISSDFTKIRFNTTLNFFTNSHGYSYTINSAHIISPCAGFIKVTGLDHVVNILRTTDILVFSRTSGSSDREVISMKPFNEKDYEHNSTYNTNIFVSPMYLPLNRIQSCDIVQDTVIYVDHYRTNGPDDWVYQDLGSFIWTATDGHQDVEWSLDRTTHKLLWDENQNNGLQEISGDQLLPSSTRQNITVSIGHVLLFESNKDEIKIYNDTCESTDLDGPEAQQKMPTDYSIVDTVLNSVSTTSVFVIQNGQLQPGNNNHIVDLRPGGAYCLYKGDESVFFKIKHNLVISGPPSPPQQPPAPSAPTLSPPPPISTSTVLFNQQVNRRYIPSNSTVERRCREVFPNPNQDLQVFRHDGFCAFDFATVSWIPDGMIQPGDSYTVVLPNYVSTPLSYDVSYESFLINYSSK